MLKTVYQRFDPFSYLAFILKSVQWVTHMGFYVCLCCMFWQCIESFFIRFCVDINMHLSEYCNMPVEAVKMTLYLE